MSEQITITISLRQAEALVDAILCVGLAAEGNVEEVLNIYVPKGTSEACESDRFLSTQSEFARQVADMLLPEIEGAYKRDPQMQDIMHGIKMWRKYCRPEG